MLPRISVSDSHSFSVIQVSRSASTLRRCRGPFLRMAEIIWVTQAPDMLALITSSAVCTPPVIAIAAFTLPARTAAALSRSCNLKNQTIDRAQNLEVNDIDIDFVKAGKENQSVDAGGVNSTGKVGESSEQWREFCGHRDTNSCLHLAHNLNQLIFDFGAARRRIAGRVIEIQFNGVGSRLLKQTGIS